MLPHLHCGSGILRLTKTIFECCADWDFRLAVVFTAPPAEPVFFFLGNYDEIQKLVRSNGGVFGLQRQ